jgi:hypothetical protein
MPPAFRLRSLGAALLIGLLATFAMAGTASAATKPYRVVVAPSSVPGGQQVFTATFTNLTAPQELGSANLTLPAGFTAISASVTGPGKATLSGNVVQLRNLALQPGASLAVTVTADVPCAAGDYAWSVIAKQSNNFSGPPGNDFGPLTADSSLTTSVTGCGAVAVGFVGQPASARVNETITTTPYNSPPGGPVTVEVTDASGNRVTTSSAVITVGLAPGSGSGTLSGTTTVTAVNGLATFDDLSIDAQGTYALVASSPGLTSATSSTFRIDESATVCVEDAGCTATATLSNGRATIDVTALSASQSDAGVLTINSNVGDPLNCEDYEEVAGGDFAVDFFPNAGSVERAKVVGLTLSKKAMNDVPENGAAHLNICFGAPFPFAVKPGTSPLQEFEGLNIGLLPDCGGAFAPPCVSKRNKLSGGRGFIEAQAPDDNRDPRFGG